MQLEAAVQEEVEPNWPIALSAESLKTSFSRDTTPKHDRYVAAGISALVGFATLFATTLVWALVTPMIFHTRIGATLFIPQTISMVAGLYAYGKVLNRRIAENAKRNHEQVQ